MSLFLRPAVCILTQLQGVLGIKVRIMKEWDPTGKVGPRTPLPDVVTVLAPKVCERALLLQSLFCQLCLLVSITDCTVLHRICCGVGGGICVR